MRASIGPCFDSFRFVCFEVLLHFWRSFGFVIRWGEGLAARVHDLICFPRLPVLASAVGILSEAQGDKIAGGHSYHLATAASKGHQCLPDLTADCFTPRECCRDRRVYISLSEVFTCLKALYFIQILMCSCVVLLTRSS